jgi:hypothetical protein
MMLVNCKLRRTGKEVTVAYFNVLSQHFPSVAEENHKKKTSLRIMVLGQRIELKTFQIGSENAAKFHLL